jgi:hypothetical protein
MNMKELDYVQHENGDTVLTEMVEAPINGGYASPMTRASNALVLRDGQIVGRTTWQSAWADKSSGRVPDIEIVDRLEYLWYLAALLRCEESGARCDVLRAQIKMLKEIA